MLSQHILAYLASASWTLEDSSALQRIIHYVLLGNEKGDHRRVIFLEATPAQELDFIINLFRQDGFDIEVKSEPGEAYHEITIKWGNVVTPKPCFSCRYNCTQECLVTHKGPLLTANVARHLSEFNEDDQHTIPALVRKIILACEKGETSIVEEWIGSSIKMKGDENHTMELLRPLTNAGFHISIEPGEEFLGVPGEQITISWSLKEIKEIGACIKCSWLGVMQDYYDEEEGNCRDFICPNCLSTKD